MAASPPDASAGLGGHDQVQFGDDGTGYESPARLKRTAQVWGQNYGASRTDEGRSVGDGAAPNRWLDGAVKVRKGRVRQGLTRAAVPFEQRISTLGARKAEARECVRGLQQRVQDLTTRQLPDLERRAQELKRVFEERRDAYLALPRMLRGYFQTVLLVHVIHLAVVAFDAGVLHGVLETSGLSTLSVWITSLTVPLAIAAVNCAFGIVAGAIGLRTPGPQRMRLAAALFVAGVGSVVVAFVLLTVFRAQAADSQNEAVSALARGDAEAQLTFFITPIWMGPLQIAGSFAAMAVTAFWVMARQGREFTELVLAPAENEWKAAEAEVAVVRRRIDATREDLEAAALVEHQIDADAEAARVEVAALKDQLKPALDAEDGLKVAVTGEYEATWTYFDQIGKNGGVWRMAMATVFPRFGRPYTPGPTDAAADDELIAQRHARKRPPKRRRVRRANRVPGNGHLEHDIDPDQLVEL